MGRAKIRTVWQKMKKKSICSLKEPKKIAKTLVKAQTFGVSI